jgi:hypothetical protein
LALWANVWVNWLVFMVNVGESFIVERRSGAVK